MSRGLENWTWEMNEAPSVLFMVDMHGKESVMATHGTLRPRVFTRRGSTTTAMAVAVLLLTGLAVAPLHAQSWPSQPIRLILPWSPGGTSDILGRIIAPKLSEELDTPVVVENRPGAGSHIGVDYVAKSRPDGYTIVQVTPEVTMGPSLFRKLNYDVMKDLKPISLVASVPLILLASPAFPPNDLRELVAYAKANPGKVTFGSGGIASSGHLAIELIISETKINMVHAPYKATGPGMVGVMGGEVDLMVPAMPTALPHIASGKVKALALLSSERNPALPNVPTAREQGINDVDVSNWWGLMVPAATPAPVAQRLHSAWIKVSAMPDVKEAIAKTGCQPLVSSPAEFSDFLKGEIARWAHIIKEAKVPPFD